MSIRVTCTGCHKRFTVSEKYAGKEGPCPACDKMIQIPSLEEEVVIHAPADAGPVDTEGRSVLQPITRTETNLSGVHWTLIAVSILGFFIGAILLRFMVDDKSAFPPAYLAIGAFFVALPTTFSGYAFLRNQELSGFVGKPLAYRMLFCSAAYTVLWAALPLMKYAFAGNDFGASLSAVVAMLALGAAVAFYLLDFDYLTGLMHYGMYLGVCLIGRWLVGVGALPGMGESTTAPTTTTISYLIDGGFPFNGFMFLG